MLIVSLANVIGGDAAGGLADIPSGSACLLQDNFIAED